MRQTPLERLRYHVTGAIKRGEAVAIVEVTPYQKHAALNHAPMSRYSPNSVDIIEECDCGARFMHNPCIGYPVTLYR